MMARAAPRATHDKLTISKSLSPRKRPTTMPKQAKQHNGSPGVTGVNGLNMVS